MLRIVVGEEALRQSVERLTPLAEIAQFYEMPVEDLALACLSYLDSGLAETAVILQQWAGAAVFNPHEMTDLQQAKLRYEANVDYRRALFHLYGQMGDAAGQRQVAADLIFWARRASAAEESYRWQTRLVEFYRIDGDERGTAVALYRQAQQYLRDQEYILAERLAQEALALADQALDEELRMSCARLLNYIALLSR